MPYLKQIAAHTNCQNIQRYLEKNDRALAKDFFNLSVDERDGYGDEGKEDIRWADEMDALRSRFGNDSPFGSLRARTYKHFIISPDPEDGIDLEALRELARAWALEHFEDYQVAIVYHDDNESRIPHAHIVVNNTNLETGRRMHHDDPKEFNRRLQEMAKERKLLYLTDAREPTEGLDRFASQTQPEKVRPKTLQQIYVGRAERELVESGSYSWVADIRNRVSVATSLARNQEEFHQVLDLLGVRASDNSRSAKRDDWIFSLVDEPTKRVSGERLGLLFAKETIMRQLSRAQSYRPNAKSSKDLLRNARNAVLLNDLQELNVLSLSLRTCAYHGVSSIEECDRKLSAMRKSIGSCSEKRASALAAKIEGLEKARNYMDARELLPARLERQSQPLRKKQTGAGRQDTHSGSHADDVQQVRQHEQQRDTATDRSLR